MDKLSLFGKTYNSIGSSDSNFIIKTKGDIKIQWGNKFIDLLKKGKINSESNDILFKKVNTKDEIKSNGIYFVEDSKEFLINIDGNNLTLNNESDTFVSFLKRLDKVSVELKELALTNIGFYYDKLEDVPKSEITSGIVFIKELNKLYLVLNGNLQEYNLIVNKEGENSEETKDNINIGDITIYNDGRIDSKRKLELLINNDSYVNIVGNEILLKKDLIITDNKKIKSEGANRDKGFRLYDTEEGSVLEVDKILCREFYKNKYKQSIIPEHYYQGVTNNIITKIEKEDRDLDLDLNLTKYRFYLKYENKFKENLKAYFYISYENQIKHYLDIEFIKINDYKMKVILTLLEEFAKEEFKIRIQYNFINFKDVFLHKGQSRVEDFLLLYVEEGIEQDPIFINSYTVLYPSETIFITDTLQNPKILFESTIKDVYANNFVSYVNNDLDINKCLGLRVLVSNDSLLKLEKTEIDVLDRSKLIEEKIKDTDGTEKIVKKNDETIHTRIGLIDNNVLDNLNIFKKSKNPREKVRVGIYSDNLTTYNSKNYDTLFYKINDYPRYLDILLPNEISPELDISSEVYDNIVPNLKWVKQLIPLPNPELILSNFIVLYNLDNTLTIPEGWLLCDGNNGTPNLVANFIKKENTGINIVNNTLNTTDIDLSIYLVVYIMKI